MFVILRNIFAVTFTICLVLSILAFVTLIAKIASELILFIITVLVISFALLFLLEFIHAKNFERKK